MALTSQCSRLRARLFRTPEGYPATRRDLARESTRLCPRDTSAWASLASALTDLCLHNQARVALRRLAALGRDEDPYRVLIRWGGHYDAVGDLKRAERWYRRAAETVPAALVFLGGVLARQGRLLEAKRCHRQATRAPGDDRLARDEAYLNLGLICRAERRYREALAYFDRAIALDPEYAAALDAQADVEAAVKGDVPEDHAAHWRQMLDAMGPTPATAHELVRAYTRRYPRDVGGWVVLAGLLSEFARHDEAVQALRRGERLAKSRPSKEAPDDRFAVQWGRLYQQKKDFRRAQMMFRRAVSLRPCATNLTCLAEVLVLQGQHTEARLHLQRALRLGPDDPSLAYYQLGLVARARGDYAEALESFDAAIGHRPKYPLALVARRDVREAIELSSRIDPWRVGLRRLRQRRPS